MLVANALNIVLAKTIFQHGGALQRFYRHYFRAVDVFQLVASCNGSGTTCCRSKCCEAQVFIVGIFPEVLVDMSKCRTRYCVVTHMVSKFAELVQNEIFWVFGHLVTCVVNFFHVALGTRSTHNVGRVCNPFVEPIESFL